MKCYLTVAQKPLLFKWLLVMKLTAFLTLFFTLNVSATGFGQDKINLRVKKTAIEGVLRSIEQQTNYRFLYNNNLEDIREKVTISVKDAGIEEVLALLLEKTRLLYQEMDNNLIVIKEDPNVQVDVVIRGKVTGDGGAPLAGASVQEKGTTTGTTTNNEGNFSLNASSANVTLVISSVGYEPQEIALGGRTDISVALVTSTKLIDQVVVIGYGTANKRDLTGSIVKISGKEVADKPNTNPVASLQGKVAGLYIVNSGTVGKEPDIRIRGTQSIGQVKPLYIVDGIFQDNINYLNPNDIESIEVMKDPSSLAIFGIRGGTGVIAISTKRAKAGQTIINYNGAYGYKELVDKLELASASEFDLLFEEENANNGVATPDYSAIKKGTNTDWIDAVTQKGKFHSHNISMSGSSEKNKFNLGLGFVQDEGIVIREKMQRYLFAFSDEYKINSAIKVGFDFKASRQNNPYTDAANVLDKARKVMPHISAGSKTFTVRDPYKTVYDSMTIPVYSGLYLQGSGVVNPVLEVENTWDKTISRENRYVGTVFAEVTFLKDFNARATWYGDISDVNTRKFNPLYYAYNPTTNQPFLYSAPSFEQATTSVEQNVDQYKKLQQDYILNYKKRFGDHSLSATAGFTTFLYRQELSYLKSTAGPSVGTVHIPDNPDKWRISNGFGKVLADGATGSAGEYTTVSWLGRILYNYRGKYFLNASIRDDASSRIPSKNRHQQFWAVGAAWELGKEDFLANQNIINYAKLKGSVGLLGNQSTYGLSSYYPSFPGIRTRPEDVALFGSNSYGSATPLYLANEDLKWETINSYEIGLELSAFNNRLRFEYNYYNKVTKDMMTYINLSSLGLLDILTNGGEVKNWGHEFSAGWTQQLGELTLTLNGNITFMKNEVVSLADEIPSGVIIDARANNGTAEARTLPGQPIGSFYGYVVEGLYQTDLDRLVSPYAGGIDIYRNGDFKFKDVNGDGVITQSDRTVIGNPSPDFIYGGTVGLRYKGFNLDVDFGGVHGNEVFRIWGTLESPFQRVNYGAFKLDRWHGAGTSNWEPIISAEHRFNYNGSTYNIEDGSYFRIRNLQLGYDVRSSFLTKARIKNLRVFANIQNLKTWKKNNGYTTEFGGSATAFGFDEAGGAIPRVTTFGLNLTF